MQSYEIWRQYLKYFWATARLILFSAGMFALVGAKCLGGLSFFLDTLYNLLPGSRLAPWTSASVDRSRPNNNSTRRCGNRAVILLFLIAG